MIVTCPGADLAEVDFCERTFRAVEGVADGRARDHASTSRAGTTSRASTASRAGSTVDAVGADESHAIRRRTTFILSTHASEAAGVAHQRPVNWVGVTDTLAAGARSVRRDVAGISLVRAPARRGATDAGTAGTRATWIRPSRA